MQISTEQTQGDVLDKEWLELMLTAKQIGLSLEEVRNFLLLTTNR
jgi:hypothetical protein